MVFMLILAAIKSGIPVRKLGLWKRTIHSAAFPLGNAVFCYIVCFCYIVPLTNEDVAFSLGVIYHFIK
jgi:hypothetical protein